MHNKLDDHIAMRHNGSGHGLPEADLGEVDDVHKPGRFSEIQQGER